MRKRTKEPAALPAPMAPGQPYGDMFEPPPSHSRLPSWSTPVPDAAGARWAFVGVHGGAGLTTLTIYSRYHGDTGLFGVEAGRGWPNPQCDRRWPVVLVARTHLSGLRGAQAAAAQYLSGMAPENTRLVGLVLVADAPGRLPAELARQRRLLDGLYPTVWEVPFLQRFRGLWPKSADPWPSCPPVVADVLDGIRKLITQESAA